MTITISTTGQHRHDQTSGPQTDNGKDELDLSVDLNELPDPFKSFLVSLSIPNALRTNAATYDYAHEAAGSTNFFVNVATDEGEVINDLYFSQGDSAGSLFDGQLATYDGGTPMRVTGSTDDIYLYSFLGGDVLIGSTDDNVDITNSTTLDPSTVVFAYYLEENASHTGADVYGVTFQPIDHPDDGDGTGGTHDEAIDLEDFLHVSASGTLSFDFDELDSGKFLWVALGDDEAGLLVTGKDLNVQDPGHAKEGDRVNGGSDPSDSMNTSQGGVGATTGVNNQLYTAGNTGVFTLVTNFTPLGTAGPQATGDNVKEIDYTGFIDTVGASIFISQTQGGDPVNLTIDVFEAAGDPDGVETEFDYIGAEGGNDTTSGAFEDDLDINVKSVDVFSANGTNLIGTWVIGTPGAGETGNGLTVAGPDGDVRVTITGSSIDVDGLQELYVVHWEAVDGSTFNRFHVTGDAENLLHDDTEFFDIGRVDVDKGVVVSENIGADVLIHDDGPEVTVDPGTGTIAHNLDETIDPDGDDTPNGGDTYANGEAADNNGDLDDVVNGTANETIVLETAPDAAEAIGMLETAAGAVAALFSVTFTDPDDFGTDGPGDLDGDGRLDTLSLVLSSTELETNLKVTALDGTSLSGLSAAARTIWLVQVDANTIEGRIPGADGVLGTGDDDLVALRITLTTPNNLATATIISEQFIPTEHGTDDALYDAEATLLTLSGTLKAKLQVDVEDADDDTATDDAEVTLISSSASYLSIDDDGPAQSVTGGGAKTVADFAMNLDETAGDPDRYAMGEGESGGGADNADDDEGDLSAVPTTALIPIGRLATSEAGGLAGLFTLAGDDGRDGSGGALAYDFSFVETDTGDAGIATNITTTATGRKVFLFLEDLDGDGENEIVGREGTAGDLADATGAVALRISIVNPTSATDAQLQAEQFVAFDHGADGGLFDTELLLKTLSSGEKIEVELKVTRTDGDTDEAVGTGTVDLITDATSPFSYDDDGPAQSVTGGGAKTVADFAMNLDETAGDPDRYAMGEGESGGGADNADDDEGDLSAVPTTALIPIGRLATSEAGGLAGLFTLAGDDGRDGSGGALAYDFSFVETDTGDAGIATNITTTATGRKVFLFLEDLDGDGENEIVGREGTAGDLADATGAVALRISIVNPTSATDAQLQAEQFVAFDHGADGGLFDTELLLKTLSSGEKIEVELKVTRTDGDTDEAVGTGTVDLITDATSPFSYDDDGPAQSVTGGGAKTVADFAMNLDETAGDPDRYAMGEGESGGGADNADDDEGDLSAVPTTALIPIGRLATSEAGGLAGLFTLAGDDGRDGSGGALAYDFSFVETDTGDAGIATNITTTATGRKVFLFLEDLDGDGENEIVGREGTAGDLADATGAVALRISIVNPTSATDAQLQAEQFVAFDHGADGGLFDTELLLKTLSSGEKIEVELKVTRTDGDTDEAVGTGTVDLITDATSPFSYDDDGPAQSVTGGGAKTVADFAMNLDETAGDPDRYAMGEGESGGGADNADDDEGDLSAVPTTALIPIGRLATSEAGGLAGLFTLAGDDGRDGSGGALAYDFSFVETDTGDAGIATNITTTATGRKVFLFLEDLDGDGENEIVGREGTAGDLADATGAVALRISIVNPTSATDAQLQAEQFVAFDHGADGGLFDTELLLKTLSSGEKIEVELKVTRTDGDTDEAVGTGTVDLITDATSPFSYDDDGPAQSVTGGGAKTVADFAMNLDETAGDPDRYAMGEGESGGGADNADDDEGDLSAVPTTALIPIGRLATSEAGGLAGLFTLAGDDGRDGSGGALAYDFSFVETDTGDAGIATNITTTATGRKVFLFLEDLDGDGENEIVGREGTAGDLADATGAVALRISIVNPTSATDAQLQAEQFVAFDHGADGGLFDTELLLKTLSSGEKIEVELKVTRTDGDTDEAVGTGTVDLITDATSPFSYDDDGPAQSVTGGGAKTVADFAMNLDETAGDPDRYAMGEGESGGGADNADDDEGDLSAVPTTALIPIGRLATSEAGGLAGLFTLAGDDGRDGSGGALAYDFSFVETDTGDAGIATNITTTATGRKVFLFLEDLDGDGENEIVGREGTAGDLADATGAVALRISIVNPTSATDAQLQAEQFVAFDHGADGGLFDTELLLKTLSSGEKIEVELKVTRTDGDTDEAVGTGTIDLITDATSPFSYDDDGPAFDIALKGTATLILDESVRVLGVDPNAIDGAPLASSTITAANLFTVTNEDFGTDGMGATPVTYAFKDPGTDLDSGITDSATDMPVVYNLEIATGDIVGTVKGGPDDGMEVVRYAINATTGDVTATQTRAVEHTNTANPDESLPHPGTLKIQIDRTIVDGDGDSVTKTVDITAVFKFEDDGPDIDITGGSAVGSGSSGAANGDLLVDLENGSSDSADLGEDSGSDGYKSIKIVDYSGDGDDAGPAGTNGADLVVNGVTLTAHLNTAGTLVNYFEDLGGVAGEFDDGIDTLYYTYELVDTDVVPDGILDEAVFTVHDVPPPSVPEFRLEDLPAGQNGFGILASRADDNPMTPLDPEGPALVIFGRDSIPGPDGTFTNKSDTINTSKGGGPTTIGVSNQMIDPPSNKDTNGEGVFFAYVSDPVDDFVSSLPDDPATPSIDEGLDQNEADDFDNIQYDGDMVETTGAFFSVVQTQGNPKDATVRITAFDVEPEDGTPNPTLQGTDLVTHDFFSEAQIVITKVTIVHMDGSPDTVATLAVGDDVVDGIDFDFNTGEAGEDPVYLGSVIIDGIVSGDTIFFETATGHDVALIEALAGKFDIGDYGIDLFNPTPDQLLSFSNEITDNDDDTNIDTHFVGIDGTGDLPPPGGYDDDMVIF